MLKRLLFAFLFWVVKVLNAQEYSVDSVPVFPGKKYVKQFYNSQRGNEYAIYNGRLHYAYSYGIEGTGYFQSADWQKGSVVYENILYENILMKYDLVKDQLIVTANETGGMAISLFSPRIKEFRFSGLQFIYFEKKNDKSSLPEGFYQLLVQGRIIALAKTTKALSEKITGTTLHREFKETVTYYILKKEHYYQINTKDDLLNALRERRKDIQALLSKLKLKYRKNPQTTIISAVELCNRNEN